MSADGNLDNLNLLRIQVAEDTDSDDQIWVYQDGFIRCQVRIKFNVNFLFFSPIVGLSEFNSYCIFLIYFIGLFIFSCNIIFRVVCLFLFGVWWGLGAGWLVG